MNGTLERDFVVAVTEMMDGQLANIQMREFMTLRVQVQGNF